MKIIEIFINTIQKISSKFKKQDDIEPLVYRKASQNVILSESTTTIEVNIENFKKDSVFVFVNGIYTDKYDISGNTIIFREQIVASSDNQVEVEIINIQM